MRVNKKKLWILLAILAAIIMVVIVAVVQSNKSQIAKNNKTNTNTNTNKSVATTEQATSTKEIAASDAKSAEIAKIMEGSKVEVPGANPITKDNKVVTQEGVAVKNDVTPMSPEAPQQTAPVSEKSLSKDVIKVVMSATGFNPKEIVVKKGQAVTLAITSGDKYTHVFMFNDPSLSAVAVGVGPGETRAITFNAPDKAGDYAFHCDVPGHAARGEVGKMIVK